MMLKHLSTHEMFWRETRLSKSCSKMLGFYKELYSSSDCLQEFRSTLMKWSMSSLTGLLKNRMTRTLLVVGES